MKRAGKSNAVCHLLQPRSVCADRVVNAICVAVGDLYRTTQPKNPTGTNQRPVLAALKIKYPKAQLIPANEVLVLAEASLPKQSSNNKQRAKEAVAGLVELGHLEHEGDNYKIL